MYAVDYYLLLSTVLVLDRPRYGFAIYNETIYNGVCLYLIDTFLKLTSRN